MKSAYFDCQFGAGADMLLAALLDCGINFETWLTELNKLHLPANSFEIKVENVIRCSLASKKVSVIEPDKHKHSPDEKVTHHHHGRSFHEIEQIIKKSALDEKAQELAISIFSNLAKAEAKVHNIKIGEVHFHEVGAIDAIIDIVGFALGYTMLSIEKTYVTPLPLGNGTVQTEHGIFPIPAPAVIELLSQVKAPTSGFAINYECTTPTAAAILTTIADEWISQPTLKQITSIGYGAGTINHNEFPNICRLIVGEESLSSLPTNGNGLRQLFDSELITVIEANLDDFSPQSLSYVVESMLDQGALDVFVTPCVMKKGRSGHLLTVLSTPVRADEFKRFILHHTSTFGVRSYQSERVVAHREWLEVPIIDEQTVRLKLSKDRQGNLLHAQPEYEDCVICSKQTGLPLKEVVSKALAQLSDINQKC